MPSQFAAQPIPTNTGLGTRMRATMGMQKRQQEADVKQHLRRLEREHKANRLMNAERVMAGKPPILPRLPLSTGPFINHHLRANSFPEWQHNRDVTAVLRYIFYHTDGVFNITGYSQYYRNLNRINASGVYLPYARGTRKTDTDLTSVGKYNLSVNLMGQFIFKNININDNDLLNYLIGNMITGTGPENYVFPTDGFISERAAKGITFQKAITQWYNDNRVAVKARDYNKLRDNSFKVDYGAPEQIEDMLRDFTPFTIPNFIGSDWATIEVLSKDKIKITIFNVSSITSGDGSKHGSEWPVSLKRHQGQLIRYGNISTTFSVTRPVDYAYFYRETIEQWKTINRH